MAWINGQWIEDTPDFGGMLGGFGGQPRFEAGYTGDTSLDNIGIPMPQPPFGDRPGMPNLPPQMNPPGYSRGPQMQPLFGGGLGNIDPWQPVQTPEWQPQPPQLPTQPPQMFPPLNIPGRLPAPGGPQMQPPTQQPIYDRGPQMQPPVPPQFPSLPPQMTFDPPTPPPIPPRPPVYQPPEIVRPPMPPIPPTIVDPPPPPPPKRDTGAAERARRLAAQKARAAAQRARDSARQKREAATQRRATLAAQKALAAQKRAADKAASKRAGKGRGYPPPPATRTQDVAKGPKGARTITGIARSQRGRGDR